MPSDPPDNQPASERDEPLLHDPLTGARSRALMHAALDQEIANALRRQRAVSLCLLDLDYFKSVNDAYGHGRGDQVLRELVERINALIRSSDLLFRYGGDEFVLVLPNTPKTAATMVAERLLEIVRVSPFAGAPPIDLSLSIGLACCPDDAQSADALLELADRYHYIAKRLGRGHIVSSDLSHLHDLASAELDPPIEREQLLGQLERFLDQLPQAGSSLFQLIGQSGTGRTRMLREAAQRAAARGLATLSISGQREQRFHAYGALASAEWPAPISWSAGVQTVARELRQMLSQRQADGLVLLIDNLELLDYASMALVQRLLELGDLPGLAVIYSREQPSAHLLWAERVTRQEAALITPLSSHGIAEWLRQALRWEAPATLVEWLAGETGGLPALLQQGVPRLIELGLLQPSAEHGWKVSPAYQQGALRQALGWRPALPPNNLTAMPTSFMGRAREIQLVSALLERGRSLTLVGPGGIGKTRLALEVAGHLLSEFAQGVYFVSMAAIVDPDLLIPTIAHTIGMSEARGTPLQEQLMRYLADRQLLLVLDNFEHVVGAAPLLNELLQAAPQLKLLVTSREVLRLSGEQIVEVPPLSLPALGPEPSLEALLQSEAVHLFVERAQALNAALSLTVETAQIIAELCHRLDGLPLAIELAAGHIRTLTPAEILARLDNRLALLTGGPHNLPERQQTLRRAIDWSYSLLNQQEQALFQLLAVFVGGCTLETIETLALRAGALDALGVLEGITSLLDKSLIRKRAGHDQTSRYIMLETIREYALEQLAAAGRMDQLRHEHMRYYLELAETLEDEPYGLNQEAWLERMGDEHGNIRAALQWALDRQDGDSMLRIAGATWKFWNIQNHLTEGAAWLRAALAIGPEIPARARALWGAGWIDFVRGDMQQARTYFEEGVSLSRALDEKRSLGLSLHGLGAIARLQSDFPQALAVFSESLALFQAVGDLEHVGWTYHHLGVLALEQGDFPAAVSLLEQCVAIFQELSQQWPVAESLTFLGHAGLQSGQFEPALQCYERALAIYEDLKDPVAQNRTRSYCAAIRLAQGDALHAIAIFKQTLKAALEQKDHWGMLWGLEQLARAAEQQGRVVWAARLYSAIIQLRRGLQMLQHPGFAPLFNDRAASLRELLGEHLFSSAWEEGQLLSLEQAVAYALEE